MVPPHVRQRRFLRQRRLDALGFADYGAYLRSSHWQDLRTRYYGSDEPQDCICGEVDGVQLHHLTYERIGTEELSDLTPLCPTCHAMIHVLEARGEIGLDFTGFVSAERAARYGERERAEALKREREQDKARKRQLRESLPLDVRLALIERAAARKRIDISSGLRVIERHIVKAERKLANTNL